MLKSMHKRLTASLAALTIAGGTYIWFRQTEKSNVGSPAWLGASAETSLRASEMTTGIRQPPEKKTGDVDVEYRMLSKKLDPVQQQQLDVLVTLIQHHAKVKSAENESIAAPLDGGTEDANASNAQTRQAHQRFPTTLPGIRAALSAAKDELQACYAAWHQLNPEVGGKIVPAFTIGVPENEESTFAQIGDVKITEGGLGNVFLEGCIRAVISDLTFEVPPSGSIQVRYPLQFVTGAP